MKKLKEYLLPFANLKIGKHHFDFQIDDKFFESFPESEIRQANIKVSLVLDKQESMLVLNFDIEGTLQVVCDRCLEEFSFPIKTEERLIVKFGTDYEEFSDDIIVIPASETEIDLQQHIYEYIMLALPIQRIHPDLPDGTSGCNQAMLDYLKTAKKSANTDPRWDTLRNLEKE